MRSRTLSALLFLPFIAQAQKLPQTSPLGKVEQVVGLTTMRVEYSRPSVRDRVIFGDLVPYGRVWRTGANKCTLFSTDGKVMVEGQELPAGAYAVFMIPREDAWTVIFNKDTALWGEEGRKEELDVLQVKVKGTRTQELVETLTFAFADVKNDSAGLVLRWERTAVRIGLHADATAQGLENIQTAVADPAADFGVYNRCARFCVDRGLMLDSALVWAEKSVSLERKFWNVHTLALARAANGRNKEAIMAAEESMKLAQEAKDEGYVKMNKARIEEWKRKR